MRKQILFLLLLLFLGLFAMKTFYGPNYFDGHDAHAHYLRLNQFDKALKDGQFPPRWAGDLLAGRGYPVFIFAYPLPYFIAEAWHLAGFSLAVSLKLTFVLAYLVSLTGMYFFSRCYWRSETAGFLSALLWSWAPPVFEKIFVGGALGEIVGFAFIPWAFLALYRLFQRPGFLRSLGLALLLSGWFLSHLLNPIVFSPLLIIFFSSQLLKNKNKVLFLKWFAFSVLLVFGLTSWFLLPAIIEIPYTHLKEFVLNMYADQFVSFKRLLYSRWGTEAPGWGNNPVSQQVGAAQWLAIGLAALLFKPAGLPFLLSFVISILLMLAVSQPLWEALPLLQLVSTPWRFLSLAVFSAAAASGSLARVIKNYGLRITVYGLLIALALYGNRNHLRINDSRDYGQKWLDNYTGVATGWNEHLPIWVQETPNEFPAAKLEVLSAGCQVQTITLKSNLQQFSFDCQQDSRLRLNTAYYPGWQVTLDEKDILGEIKTNLENSNGMMEFAAASGRHQLTAKFTTTPLRTGAGIVSWLTLVFLMVYQLVKKRL